MYGVSYRYIGDEETARDVMHDAFIHMFNAISNFHSSDIIALQAWMRRVVTTEALGYLRSHRMEMSNMEIDNLPEEETPVDETETEKIPQDVLMDMIAGLPEGYRTIFNMYVIDSFSHKDIAKKLGISEKTSSSQFFRAKSLLAKQIKEYLNEAEE